MTRLRRTMRLPYSDLKFDRVSLDALVTPFLPSCTQFCFRRMKVCILIVLLVLGSLVHHHHCHAFMLGYLEYFFNYLFTNVCQNSLSFVKDDGLCYNIEFGCTFHYQFWTRQGRRKSCCMYNPASVDLLRHEGLPLFQFVS